MMYNVWKLLLHRSDQHSNNKNKIVLFLIVEIIIQHIVSGKWDLLKMFEGRLDFFVSFIPGTI